MNRLLFSLLFIFNLCYLFGESQIQKTAYVISLNGIYLRKSPSINSDKKSAISFQERVEVLGIENNKEEIDGITSNWLYIRYGVQVGYVFGGYLSFMAPKKSDISMYDKIRNWYKKSIAQLNIHNQSLVIGMSKDKIVGIIGYPINVMTFEGSEALVFSEYSVLFDYSKKEDEKTITGFIYFMKQWNITSSEVLESIGKPDLVVFDSENDQWCLIYKSKNTSIEFLFTDINDYMKSLLVLRDN